MSQAVHLCPVCQRQEALFSEPGEEMLVSCVRCGDYRISSAAENMLLGSSAPVPLDYRVSHAFRWAMHGDGLPALGRRGAERLIQRRRSTGATRASHIYLLRWLEVAGDVAEALPIEGWTAVLNGKTTTGTARRLDRLVRSGLVSVDEDTGGLVEVRLEEEGRRALGRVRDRSRRMRERRERGESYGSAHQSRRNQDRFYASSLFVERFKCFGERQEISFRGEDGRIARWTFLIGENGVGKTSVLHLVAGLTPTRRPGKSRPYMEPEPPSASPLGSVPDLDDAFNVEMEFHQGALGEELSDPAIFGVMGGDWSADDLETSLKLAADSIQMSWRNALSYSAGYDAVPVEPLVIGYGASRAVAKGGFAPEKGRVGATNSLFHPETPLQDPEDWLLRNDYAARFHEPAGAARSAANGKLIEALVRLLPDVSAISILPPDATHDRPWVAFMTSLGSVDFMSLSTGYRSTVAWIIDLAIRLIEHYPAAEDPLGLPAIVLVDEMDIHLHPTWQRSITSDLEALFPAVQFIATTHSPLIIQGAVEANLVLLRSDGRQVLAINDVDEIRHFRVDQILTSELFGLRSARADEDAELFRRRTELLSSGASRQHTNELAELDRRLGTLPDFAEGRLPDAALAVLRDLKA